MDIGRLSAAPLFLPPSSWEFFISFLALRDWKGIGGTDAQNHNATSMPTPFQVAAQHCRPLCCHRQSVLLAVLTYEIAKDINL
jgi:hypothetical protein